MDYSMLLGWLPAPFVLYVMWLLLQNFSANILAELAKIEPIEKTLAQHAFEISRRATQEETSALRERIAVLEAKKR
jgi:hypothetical protein